MSTVVDQIPEVWRRLFVEVLAERAPQLLQSLGRQDRPTLEQAEEAKRILQREFVLNIDENSEPTARGRQLDDLIGDFIHRFVIVQK